MNASKPSLALTLIETQTWIDRTAPQQMRTIDGAQVMSHMVLDDA